MCLDYTLLVLLAFDPEPAYPWLIFCSRPLLYSSASSSAHTPTIHATVLGLVVSAYDMIGGFSLKLSPHAKRLVDLQQISLSVVGSGQRTR